MIALVLGLVVAVQPLWAQTTYAGLRSGVNLARWHWENDADVDKDAIKNLPGLYIAVPFEVSVTNGFFLQPELAYTRKGVRMESKETGEIGTFEMQARTKFDYFSLDMLLKGKFGSNVPQFYVLAGPGLAYATHGKVTAEFTVTNGTSTTEKETEDIDFKDDEVSRFDFTVLFGGGVEVPLGPGRMVLDARYNLGLQNLNTEDPAVDDVKIFNRGLLFSAGFMVPLGK